MNRIYSVTLAGAFIAIACVVFFQKLGSEKTALSNGSSSPGSGYEKNSRSVAIRSAKSSRRIIKRSKPKALSDYQLKNPSEIYSLTVDQATELVARYEGLYGGGTTRVLKLPGLASIDKDVAYELAKWKGQQLYLEGLTSVNEDVAYGLAQFKGSLVLGLSSIDTNVAEELAKKEGGQLHLWDLVSIDKDAAQALSRFGGTYLSLKGVELIDRDVARELSNSDVSWLSLTGLTAIDSDVAQEMAQFRGQLSFSNLSIDREAAEKLANYAGRRMYINGFQTCRRTCR